MARRFSVEAVFKAKDRMTAPVSRMQNRVSKMTRSMTRGYRKLNKVVGKFAAGVKKGSLVVVASLAATSAAMASVIGTGAEFEQTLVNAAAKFPGEIRKGTEAFEQLEKAAKKTGSSTEFSASQAAGALNFLAMAGFSAEGAVAALPGVVDLATAAQVDLATATDVASDSLGAFGLMTKDTSKLGANLARINDVIAKTTTSSNTTVEALFETIKDGAPIATTAGASLETFAALAGELANSGIKGSKAGTTLKNMFLSLSAPSAGASKLLKKLGVTTQDSNGDLLDIVDILGNLNGSLAGLGTAQKSGVLEGIFGKIPIAGVNILLASGSKRLNEYRTQLEGASGASTEMAKVMRDTLQGRLNSLTSAVEGVKISIFSMTDGPLSDAIDKTTEWVRANEALIATNVGGFISDIVSNFSEIVGWIKKIAIGLAVFIAFTTILKTLGLVLTVVNLLMAANPVTLVILGIMLLIAAITALVFWWDNLVAAFRGTSDMVSGVIAALGFLLGPIGLLIAAGALLIKHWEPVKEFFIGLWDSVGSAFDTALERMLSVVDKIKAAMSFVKDKAAGVTSFFGFGDDGEAAPKTPGVQSGESSQAQGGASPQVISPQDRVAKSIEERRSTSSAEVTIRDETKRAEVTGGKMGNGIQLTPSGAF